MWIEKSVKANHYYRKINHEFSCYVFSYILAFIQAGCAPPPTSCSVSTKGILPAESETRHSPPSTPILRTYWGLPPRPYTYSYRGMWQERQDTRLPLLFQLWPCGSHIFASALRFQMESVTRLHSALKWGFAEFSLANQYILFPNETAIIAGF